MTREEEIFAAALLLSGAARREYLDRACGDDRALRENVEALLEAHDSAHDFLAGSPADEVFAGLEPQPGERIGPYLLLRKLGEGGCGLVFLAEQEQPLRRQVALKLIKPGMDSRQVIARFEAERQALAQMDHPDIAKVFDAGATPAGRPYFAMEYVAGVPITRYCDEAALPLAARLALFERVCLALQHAHQKGIIHRDVKPSNILVAVREGVPAIKVIDFGIAKATQARLTDATTLTGFEQFLGTPAYMSPEQAERRDLDIDTRSDIYSLGVLLYELLAGQPPFDPKSLVQAGVDEIRRIIREVDPPRPSTALSTLGGQERTAIARRRAAAPERLSSVLRGDLDWIVMRCLEKDRGRRYGTAHELAADIGRHLRSEPVTARPPSAGYRAGKFLRRHRLACGAAAAVALSLVVGIVVSVAQAIRANRAERDARQQQEQAESLLTFMLGDFRTELKKIGQLKLLNAVGDQAMAHFAALDPRQLSDTSLTRQAKALTQIGEVRLEQARPQEALAAFTVAYSRAAALTARHPANADMLFERAQAEYWIGSAARRRGDFAVTREWFTHYRDSALALVALEGRTPRADLEVAYSQHNLAVLDLDEHDHAAARRGMEAERAALENRLRHAPNDTQLLGKLADCLVWLGLVALGEGTYDAALQHTTAGATAYEQLTVREPTVANWAFRQANSLGHAGDIQGITGRHAEAAATYARAMTLLDSLIARDPANARWELAWLNMKLCQAELQFATGQPAAAATLLAPVLTRYEALVAAEPTARVPLVGLAAALRLQARLRFHTGAPDAEPPAQRALTLTAQLAREARADNRALYEHAQAALLVGRLAQSRQQLEVARRYWQQVIDLLLPRFAATNDWRLLDPLAQAHALLGDTARARPALERLQRAGYLPLDPLATPLLGAAP